METRKLGERLNEVQKAALHGMIVKGMGLRQINQAFEQAGWKPISASTLWHHNQDEQVIADMNAVIQQVRVQAMAQRRLHIQLTQYRLCELRHQMNGTTPPAHDIELIDDTVPIVPVSSKRRAALAEMVTQFERLLATMMNESLETVINPDADMMRRVMEIVNANPVPVPTVVHSE